MYGSIGSDHHLIKVAVQHGEQHLFIQQYKNKSVDVKGYYDYAILQQKPNV
jgi:hypothetical protein